MTIRRELLVFESKWNFSVDLSVGYQKPPMLSFMLQTLLFGKHGPNSKKSAKIACVVENIE